MKYCLVNFQISHDSDNNEVPSHIPMSPPKLHKRDKNVISAKCSIITLGILFAGNGNDQNFQGGVFSARGGYFGFSAQGGVYTPLWKNRKFGF